ncbi:fatty acyl-AMP ligase [Nocardia yamanashiensis]|uniref:fatty acyl-AMP ligase n=1 Tax=Nocardia yamanashiensis TaxID=209247 RepID=UPI001E320FA1|nr:fatty acyl-AMP ligase [Nocardia yamanashiensis]UGT42563.1 fatty acyl-AMP ligase [Nocardia yamanashiensis]
MLPAMGTFRSLLEMRRVHDGDRIAYRFLADGLHEAHTLTFAELDLHGRAIAAALQQCAAAGERALILAADGYDFVRAFIACQYANVIAVPAYPPFPARSGHRVNTLRSIVQNCRPSVVLAAGAPADKVVVQESVPELQGAQWIFVDQVSTSGASDYTEVPVRPEDISFLQYTSGSTSAPKGVVITHEALLHNERLIASPLTGLESQGIGVSWLPLYHDMGLIGNLLGVVYTAVPGVFMSPLSFLHRPARWLQTISKYGATISGGPNFAYDLCLRRITPQECEGLDLSSWQFAFNGAEPARASTLDAFAERFGPYGFDKRAWYVCYGLAEATVMVSGAAGPLQGAIRHKASANALAEGRFEPAATDSDAIELVGCGTARLHRRIEIVAPDTGVRCPDGTVGEIWASGPDMGSGYWQNPEQSAHTFAARLAETNEGPFMRTGDLGLMLDGELFVTGRIKDLIIIGGRNHYPTDLEETVESVDPTIRAGCSIAFTVGAGGADRLIIVAETTKRNPDDHLLLERLIRGAISKNHGVQVNEIVLVKPNSVPRTSSGKPRRNACRVAFESGELKRLNGQEFVSISK